VSVVAVQTAATESLLKRLVDETRRAVACLDADDVSGFEDAVAMCETLRDKLVPMLALYARMTVPHPTAGMDSIFGLLTEAAAEHEVLSSRASQRRDLLAMAIEQVNRPDVVANAYATAPSPLLSFVR
jgi:hypothetical protein